MCAVFLYLGCILFLEFINSYLHLLNPSVVIINEGMTSTNAEPDLSDLDIDEESLDHGNEVQNIGRCSNRSWRVDVLV